ncbi:MAG: hypothetical protein WCI92_18150 [Bacteroidota bacterium]
MKTKIRILQSLLVVVLLLGGVLKGWTQNTQTVCPGTEPYSVTPGNALNAFLWTITPATGWTINSGQGTPAISVTWADPGVQTVYTVTLRETNATCYTEVTVEVTVNPAPVLVITNPNAVCGLGPVDLTAASITSGSTLPPGTTLGYFTDLACTTPLVNPNAVTASGTYYIKASTNTTPACFDIKPVVVIITPSPIADAGLDQTICSGSDVTLAGAVSGSATTGSWSGGNGTYNPNANTLNAVYTPSAAEITAGFVTLTLTTNDPDGIGPCTAATDQITITINPAAIANAGIDQTICSGSDVILAGVVSGSASSGAWSGGTGSFNPNANTLNAVYTPSVAETTAGFVTLTLTTNDPDGTGPCSAATDQITITINPTPIADAGVDQTICSGSTVTLAGSVSGSATTGSWSGGSGTFNPDANTLNAVYTPTAAEITAGFVTLTLTTNDPDGTGPCSATSDQILITINPAAIANAGIDQTICSGSDVTLAGAVSGSATTGTWSGGSGTFNPGANTLNAVYTPSAAEITAGFVTLTLTTNDPDGIGPCSAATDQVTILINLAPNTSAIMHN